MRKTKERSARVGAGQLQIYNSYVYAPAVSAWPARRTTLLSIPRRCAVFTSTSARSFGASVLPRIPFEYRDFYRWAAIYLFSCSIWIRPAYYSQLVKTTGNRRVYERPIVVFTPSEYARRKFHPLFYGHRDIFPERARISIKNSSSYRCRRRL